MRRFIISSSLVFIVLFGLVAMMGRRTHAQEPFATPGAGEFELVPGQIGRELTSGRLEEPPSGPLHLGLLRFTSYPGSVLTTPEDDPTAALILVESGEVTLRLEGAVTITRTTGPEEVAAGTEITLGPGESFVWAPYVAGELRIDGQEPAVTLVAFLAPAVWEFEESTPTAGTPTP